MHRLTLVPAMCLLTGPVVGRVSGCDTTCLAGGTMAVFRNGRAVTTRPTNTTAISDLIAPERKIEIEATAYRGE